MSTAARSTRAYKELTLQQLRSFCETARTGSLKAAADSLQLAHPTVWQQVHALERQLGAPLIERHGRGSRLTEEGKLLAELASHLVTGVDSLTRVFQEARSRIRRRLTVVTTQRTLTEDLPDVVVAFESCQREVLLCFVEVGTDDVISSVDSGVADVGLTSRRELSRFNPQLTFEKVYELDLLLITPRDHPLARRRRVTPEDLRDYPWVNKPNTQPAAAVNATLDALGVFHSEPRRIEARYTATVRRYVELGFGIGLVVGRPTAAAPAILHERSMSEHFGRVAVYAVWRNGTLQMPLVGAFIEVIKKQLSQRFVQNRHKSRRRMKPEKVV